MEVARHLEALRREGELLAAAAARADLDTPVPTCPGWTVRDLVSHIGDVHRWATTHVAERRTEPITDIAAMAGPLPGDGELLDWFRRGHARLLETLATADPDLECWTFLPAPSSVAFWARRQAHETGIHRADAESPGAATTPFEPDVAADGIEEMLFGFLGRPNRKLRIDPARTLHLHATDAAEEWLARIGPEGLTFDRARGPADLTIRATASDLYLLVWNRRDLDGLDVAGDRALLDVWRGTVQITWGLDR